jgi:hypothetical protein
MLDSYYNVNAVILYVVVKPGWNDDRGRVVITSPPYGRLPTSRFARGYDRLTITRADNLTLFRGRHLRAAWLGILSGIYLCLRGSHHINDVVLKNFANNGLRKQQKTYATRELAGFVGFRLVEVLRFCLEGNRFDRYHEYVMVLGRVISMMCRPRELRIRLYREVIRFRRGGLY